MAGTSKSDARDILSLPSSSIRGEHASTSSKPNKSSGPPGVPKTKGGKSAAARAELGISRELYALLGDSAPSLSLNPNNLSNNPLLAKKQNFKPKFKRKPTKAKKWKQIGFLNPARNDGLVLKHWNLAKLAKGAEKEKEAEAGTGTGTGKEKEAADGMNQAEDEEQVEREYRFSQFNTTSGVYSYSNDEYNSHLRDEDWTQAETDYLMDLCVSHDLRFVVIQDRYDWPGGKSRSIEDLKSRYYAICRRLIRSRISAEDLESRQALVNTYLFDPKREIERKKGVLRLFERTPSQLAEEEALYVEAKRMEQNEARFSSERESLLRLLGGWESLPNAGMEGVARAGSGLNVGLSQSSGSSNGGVGVAGGGGEEEGRLRRKRHTEDQTPQPGTLQVLTTKQKNEMKQVSFDLEHCIQRFDPLMTIPSKPLYPHLIGVPSSYPPTLASAIDGPTPNTNVNLNSNASHGAYFRSARILTTRPHLTTRTNQTLSELKPPVGPKLVFPTARNIEKWEGLLGAVTSGLEMKKALDRVESELRVAQARFDTLLKEQQERELENSGKEKEGQAQGEGNEEIREKTQEELRAEKSMESMIQARDQNLERDRIDLEVGLALKQSIEREKEREKEGELENSNKELREPEEASNKRPRSEGEAEAEDANEDPSLKKARAE